MSFVKARGGGFGMDAELASKLNLKFDSGRAAVAVKWLCDLTCSRLDPAFLLLLKPECFEQAQNYFQLKKWVPNLKTAVCCALQPIGCRPTRAPRLMRARCRLSRWRMQVKVASSYPQIIDTLCR
jgi:hypothetical protein